MHSIRTLAFNQRLSELEVLEIDNPSCTAKIALQGAQILQFQPKQSAQPLLWLSSANSGKKGKALRGGIPLCFPWFGSHPQGLQPAHGFARNQLWTLQEVVTMQSRQPIMLILLYKILPQHDKFGHTFSFKTTDFLR